MEINNVLNGKQNSPKALIGPSVSVILAALGISSVAVVLPQLSQEFTGSLLDPSLVVSAYILAVTALIVPAGRAGDIFGKRTILIAGLLLFLFGVLAAYFSTTLSHLIISRLAQGAGAAAMMAMPLAQVREFAPQNQTGRWMGVMGTMSAIGTASGPALAGMIASHFDWRAVFLFQVPLTVIALVFCFMFSIRGKRLSGRSRIDYAGAATLAALLASFVLLMSDLKDGIDVGALPFGAVTLLLMYIFWMIEKRAHDPLIPLALVKSVDLRISFVMNATVSMIMMGMLIVGPYFLTLGLGLTTAQMGLAMSVGPVASAFSGMPAGRLTEKLGAHRTVLLGLLAMILSTVGYGGASLPIRAGWVFIGLYAVSPQLSGFSRSAEHIGDGRYFG